MSNLIGVRVVRGPDWKWGDQDGGEGYAGTVIDTQSGSSTRPVTVFWDSGFEGHYRAGPMGCYDLRIVDDPGGELHRNIICGNPDCNSEAIRGMRWKCVDCELSFCNACFMKKTPHDKKHNQFQRFDSAKVVDPPIVTTWNRDQPENRIKLMGTFNGAEVIKSPIRTSGLAEDKMNIGVVYSDETDESGKILVEWTITGEQSMEERYSSDQLRFAAVIGGYYYPKILYCVKIRKDENTNAIQSFKSSTLEEWTNIGAARFFMEAIEKGEIEIAQFLFNTNGLVVDICNVDGSTALHVACSKGHVNIVSWLLDIVKMDMEKPDDGGFRAIHHAVQQCEPEVLEILIRRGAQLNVLDGEGRSVLHIAVKNRFTECVRLLIRSGCDVNIPDADGRIIFHSTISSGTALETIIEALTSSPQINWKLKDSDGFNVLHLAVIKNDLKAIECILKNMNVNLLLECMPNSQNMLLHYACIHRNAKVAKLLLHSLKAADEMTSFTCRLEEILEAKGTGGMTALLIAVSKKDYQLIELLVDAGADMNVTDKNGDTALIHAAKDKDPSFKYWIPPKDSLSPTLLKALKKYPSLYFMGYLIEKGFSWNTANSSGQKPADFLSKKGYPEEAIEILNRLFAKVQISKRRSSVGTVCMGRDGCIQPPEFQLICPHNSPYKACSHCFVKYIEGAICGCDDEVTSSVLGDPRKRDDRAGAEQHQSYPSVNGSQILDNGVDASNEENRSSDNLESFAKHFRLRRQELGFSQSQVGVVLGARYHHHYSDATISRFETLKLSFIDMCKLKPKLEKWLKEAELAASTNKGIKRKSTEESVNKQPKLRKMEPLDNE